MATISIPWQTGSGNIVIEYNGEGNGALLVYSDSENSDSEERSQSINVMTTAGAPQVAIPLTVRQGAKENPYLLLESGGKVLLQSGDKVVLENSESGGAVMVESITIDGYTLDGGSFVIRTDMISAGSTNGRLVVTVSPENATNKALSFRSSNTSVATIDNEGNFTLVGNPVGKSVYFLVDAQDGSGAQAIRLYNIEP